MTYSTNFTAQTNTQRKDQKTQTPREVLAAADALFPVSLHTDAAVPTPEAEGQIRGAMNVRAQKDAELSFLFWQCLERAASSEEHFGLSRSMHSDFGPPERWQHSSRCLEMTETPGVFRVRVMPQCALDALVNHALITPENRDAALRLKSDFLAAGLGSQVIAQYDRGYTFLSVSMALSERSPAQEAAYERWSCAVKASRNGMIANVLISVACCDEVPPGDCLGFLKFGLNRLITHYDRVDNTLPLQSGDETGDGAGADLAP